MIDAALVVLGRDGLAAVTHRSVAGQAGVPLASASYHFSGIDELIATAMRRASDDLRRSLQDRPGQRDIHSLARLLAEELDEHRELMLAGYEAYLHAARHPTVTNDALSWLDVILDAYAPDLHGDRRAALAATIEGLCLHALLQGPPVDVERVAGALRAGWPG